MKNLNPNLKKLRIEKKKKQDELAEYLRVTTRQYQRYESGEQEPNLDKLIKIADYFDVSTDYLLGRTDDPQFYGRRKWQNFQRD